MVITLEQRQVYSEVLEVLRHMDKTYVDKIPKKLIMFFYDNCSLDYEFRMTKAIGEEKFKPKTLDLLALLNYNYWSKNKSKEELIMNYAMIDEKTQAQLNAQLEKEKAICMIEQTIEFTDNQITREKKYLNMYKAEEINDKSLKLSNVISLDYYDNILSNEVILQNANMNTYGEIMRYMEWIEYYDSTAKTAEGDAIYSKLYNRYANMKKVSELLTVCRDEMRGDITPEEAMELCKEIKYDKEEKTS